MGSSTHKGAGKGITFDIKLDELYFYYDCEQKNSYSTTSLLTV
jgi:hypothetical protein